MRARTVLALIAVAAVLSITSQRKFPTPSYGADRQPEDYALIFGTVWGPDNQPVYGVKVKVRRTNPKSAKWELISDHRGEFAQRVPTGPGDYEVSAEPVHLKKGGRLTAPPVKVHIDAAERQDIGLHLK